MQHKFEPKCVEETKVSRIKVEESGRKVIILNPANADHIRVQIDGCVVTDGERADWGIGQEGVGFAVIELKGRDVRHGLAQIEASLSHIASKGLADGPFGALLMCKQVPKPLTVVQAAAERVKARHKAKLTVSSSQYEFAISDLVFKPV